MIEIQGDVFEGGGQILRTAIALSTVIEKPFRIFNIRAKRRNPGIRPQHLEAIRAVAKLCDAEVRGADIGNKELKFYPKRIRSGKIDITIPTAGSIGLMLQGLMIAASRIDEDINVRINGGATNGKWAAPVNFIKHVLIPILSKMGYRAWIEIERYGYYPVGGAKVKMKIEPSKLSSIKLLEQEEILSINGISHASLHLKKSKVAERQQKAARDLLFKKFQIEPEIKVEYVNTDCPGSAIDLWIKTKNSFLGDSSLGEPGKPAEEVGKDAAWMLINQHKSSAPLDSHMSDQIIPYMALGTISDGESMVRASAITNHTKTNIWVVEQFLPVKFSINEKEKIISCRLLR